MFRDTAVTDHDPSLPTASRRRRPSLPEAVCEPEPLVVICFVCASARDGHGRWTVAPPLERLLAGEVTHGLCPACLERLYPEPSTAAVAP
jgi:hypothetical protein